MHPFNTTYLPNEVFFPPHDRSIVKWLTNKEKRKDITGVVRSSPRGFGRVLSPSEVRSRNAFGFFYQEAKG